MSNKFNKVADTSHPTLTRAVIRQLGGRDALIDVASPKHGGADAGFCNFVYYKDTVPFFERQRQNILSVLEADADDFGEEPASIVMQLRWLNLSKSDLEEWRTYRGAVNRLLYGNRKVDWDKPEEVQISNSLSWYALESVARMMVE